MSTFQRFVRNNEGSATVEFVLALPILLALMAFSIQYGNALAIRNNLDVAARDAARYLARAPLNDSTGASIDSTFINKSQAMVAERVLFTKSTITTFSANSDVDGATVEVTIDVPFPLLAWLGLFDTATPSLTMSSSEYWVRTGDRVVMEPLGG